MKTCKTNVIVTNTIRLAYRRVKEVQKLGLDDICLYLFVSVSPRLSVSAGRTDCFKQMAFLNSPFVYLALIDVAKITRVSVSKINTMGSRVWKC